MKMKKIFMFMPFLLAGFLLTLASCGNLGGGGNSVGGGGKDEHNWTLVTGKPATCQEEGMKDYYTCSHCNEYKGTDGAIYTSLDEFILPRVDHNYNYVEGFTGCEGEGLKTHFTCEYCDTLFDEYKNPTTEEELKVIGQHNLNFVYGYEAGCTSEGRVSHYECSKCMECFEDENATVKINREDTIIPSTHNLTHYDEVKATCDNSGNKEYWRCNSCYTYFLSEEAVTSVEWSEIYLPQLQHSFTHYDVESEATCETDRVEVAHCDHEGCDEIDTKTIENSKLGHNFVDGKCTNCQCNEFSEGLEYYFEIDENDEAGIVITGLGTCTDRDIIIPEKLRGLPVVAVNFYYSIDIDSIYIPKTVRSIRRINSSSLKEVILDEECALEELGYEAFRWCTSLESISLPQSCQKIGNYAFADCTSLKHINLDFVVEIGQYAFYDCTSLEYVSIQRATKIGTSAFFNTTGLGRVEMNQAIALETMGSYCFKNSGLTYISFPKSLSKIAERAFEDCQNLETVVFQQGNVYIDQYAFLGCDSLKEINLPKSIVSIGDSAFKDCKSLEVVKMDSTVLETVGKSAFEGCTSLKEIYMPNNTSVDFYSGVFIDDKAIETIYIANSHLNQWLTYSFTDETSNPLHIGDVTIKAYVSQVNDYLEIDGIDLTTSYGTTVPDFAFYNTKYEIKGLESVIFAGNYAFAKVDSLVNIYLDKCAFIGVGAFSDCKNLETVRFLTSDSPTPAAICGAAFAGCSKITDLVIPNYFDEFGMGAFAGLYNLNSLSIPFIGLENKTSSDERQYPLGALFSSPGVSSGEKTELEVYQEYYKNSATTLTGEYFYIPSSLKHVSVTSQEELLSGSLMNIKLDSLTINADCLKLNNNYNISGDSLIKHFVYRGTLAKWFTAEIVGLTYTGDYFYTYEGGNLTLLEHIVIPANIVNINQNLFRGVQSVRSLTIDHKVLCNVDYAFLCPNLYEIYITADPAEFNLTLTPGGYDEYGNASRYAKVIHYSSEDPSIFYEDDNGFKFICHEDTKVLYGVPAPIDGYLELPESFTYNDEVFTEYTIAPNTFAVVNGLKELVIPNSVTDLAEGVFGGCSSLEKLTVPSMFGKTLYALFGCEEANDMDTSLEEVYVTNETTDIAERAFYNCDSLEVIHIEGTLENVGAYAFAYCDRLEEVILADSIKTFSTSVFSNSASLKKVWLPASLEQLERNIFYSSKNTLVELRTPFLGESRTSTDNCSLNYLFDNNNSVYNYVSKLETLIILGGNISGKGISNSNIVNLTIPVYASEGVYFTVTDIHAFRSVENLYFAGTLEDWCNINNGTINAHENGDNFYILDEKGEYYLLNESETLVIPASVTYIAPYAFYKIEGVKYIVFEESTETVEIDNRAFAYITDAKTIIIPDNAKFVSENVFALSSFEEVTVPNLYVNGTASTLNALMKTASYDTDKNETLKKFTITGESPFSMSQLRYYVAIEELYMSSEVTVSSYTAAYSSNVQYVSSTLKAIYIDGDLQDYCESTVSYLTCGTFPIYIKDDNGEYYNLREESVIIVPEGTTKVTNYTFNNFSNLVVYIPASTTIENNITKYDSSSESNITNGVVIISGATSGTNSSIHYGYSLNDVYQTKDYVYLLEKDYTAKIVSVTNRDLVNAVIPATITVNSQTYTVTTLTDNVFANLESLEYIDLPNTITYIGEYCFSNTPNLRKFIVPESVTYIGEYLFGRNMQDRPVVVYINSPYEKSFDSYWDYTGGGVGDSNSIYDLSNPYAGSTSGMHNNYYYFESGDFEFVVSDGYTGQIFNKREVVIARYIGDGGEVVIPDTVMYEGVEYPVSIINGKAFTMSDITKITLGANITQISDRAFRDCNLLEEIVFNDKVFYIDDYAFYGCDSLEKVAIPSNITYIGYEAFKDCGSLVEFTYEERGDKEINVGYDMLQGTNIEIYYHPSSVTSNVKNLMINSNHIMYYLVESPSPEGIITENEGEMVFYYGVNDETLYKSEEIGATFYLDKENNIAILMFVDNTVTNIDVPENIEVGGTAYKVTLGVGCFANRPIETFTLNETITEIPRYAFYNTDITEVELEHVVKIGDSAFSSCEALTKFVISSKLENMGWNVLYGSNNVVYLDIPFIGEKRAGEHQTIAFLHGGYYSSGVLQSNGYLGNKLDTVIIRETTQFAENSLKGLFVDELYLHGDIEYISGYAFNYYDTDKGISRIYISSSNIDSETLSNIVWRLKNTNTIILYSGNYEGSYANEWIFGNYTEDTYPTIDQITYKIDGENAIAIHVETSLKGQEGFTLPETIEYKGTTYTVIENTYQS